MAGPGSDILAGGTRVQLPPPVLRLAHYPRPFKATVAMAPARSRENLRLRENIRSSMTFVPFLNPRGSPARWGSSCARAHARARAAGQLVDASPVVHCAPGLRRGTARAHSRSGATGAQARRGARSRRRGRRWCEKTFSVALVERAGPTLGL